MASSNGPWQNRARVFFDFTDPVVNPSTAGVTLDMLGYLQMDEFASSSGTYPWAYSGDWGSSSGSTFHNLGPMGYIQLVNLSTYFPLTDSWQYPTMYMWADHYAANLGGTGRSEHSVTLAIPPRFAVTPTSLTVTRVSDGQQNLAWTRNSVYSQVIIQRSTDGGAFQEIARAAGNAASFSDTTTSANHLYVYRVAGNGGSGQSGWSNTATIYTTPAPVASIVAERVNTTQIQLTVTGLPPYATSYDIYDNGVLVSPSGVDVTSFPWVHAAPNPAVVHVYTIRSKRGVLVSAQSAPSNAVQLQAPPNAPTNLAPNGTLIVAAQATLFSWQHNPVDTSAQTAYELRYRLIGAGVWTTVSGTTLSTHSLTLALGDYEWQVRTKGADPGWSPWSAVATTTAISQPGAALTTPPLATWDLPTMTVAWSYFQAQSRPQSAWQVQLLDASNQVIEDSGVRSGNASSYTLTTRLLDGQSYTVRVRVATGEVWSAWSSQFFEVAFIPPAPLSVTSEWDEETGLMSITVCVPEPEEDVPPSLSTLIERSFDGGASWSAIGTFSLDDECITFSDPLARSCGVTLYRVTGFAESGASTLVTHSAEARSRAIYLGGNANFSHIVRLPADLSITITRGRRRMVQEYVGRPIPVAYSSRRLSRTVEVSGTVPEMPVETTDGFSEGTRIELEDVALERYPLHAYRDMHGNVILGSLSLIQSERQVGFESCGEGCLNAIWGFSFTLIEAGANAAVQGG